MLKLNPKNWPFYTLDHNWTAFYDVIRFIFSLFKMQVVVSTFFLSIMLSWFVGFTNWSRNTNIPDPTLPNFFLMLQTLNLNSDNQKTRKTNFGGRIGSWHWKQCHLAISCQGIGKFKTAELIWQQTKVWRQLTNDVS